MWVRAGEYTLACEWRDWALKNLGVPSENLVVDLFARTGGSLCPLAIPKHLDAFTFEWAKLLQSPSHFLWANPPFSIMERVVAKLQVEPCRIILCSPVWPEASWWDALQALTTHHILLPQGEPLFYGAVRKKILPPPDWRVMICWIDSTTYQGPPPKAKVLTWVREHCEGKGLRELQDELNQTNLPMGDMDEKIPEILFTPPVKHREEGSAPRCTMHEEIPMETTLSMTSISNASEDLDEFNEAFISGLGVQVVERERPIKLACEIHLRLLSQLKVPNHEPLQVKVLVDTGAEVCLIRKGLVAQDALTPAEKPLRLVAANNQRLHGGDKVLTADLHFQAAEWDTKKRITLTAPTTFYEAAMVEDVILSYRWLAERYLDVCPRLHGLRTRVKNTIVWIPGERLRPTPKILSDLAREPLYTQVVTASEGKGKSVPLRALDLFCGRKSAAQVLQKWGYEVTTLDSDPIRQPSICTDIMEWDYKAQYPPGYFHLIAASPPCTEYSRVKNKGPRDLDKADAIVAKTLEIIHYFQPTKWWLETPRNGILARRELTNPYPYVDVDYCQFEECGFQKPTRFFGSDHLRHLPHITCNQRTCTSLIPLKEGEEPYFRAHYYRMGGPERSVDRELAYHIPEGVVEYVAGFGLANYPEVEPEDFDKMAPKEMTPELQKTIEEVRCMRLWTTPTRKLADEDPDTENEVLEEIASRLLVEEANIASIKGGPEARETVTNPLAQELRQKLIDEFKDTALSGKYLPNPPVRGPFGEAEIWLKPDAKPVSQPPFQLTGERRQALAELVEKAREMGKLESGKGPWNTPAFPVTKKVPGTYRLVQDLRPQNEATLKDGHPLPRIGDILQRQGKARIWTTLDLVDGFHQMPLKKEHRYITCMSTPHGTQQWTVQVMGLKNAATQFQRMMEWVLEPHPYADPYVDDVINGSEGQLEEDAVRDNYEKVRAVLKTFEEQKIVCHPGKSEFFQNEVEFCGHILREGRRSPAPGKLLPIQNWELPKTVTELRGFLGLTNYFSEYVHHYAEVATPLMGKLKLSREDGKKGSRLRLVWTEEEKAAFHTLKKRLCEKLELWQLDVDKPFQLACDASGYAIGAELQQEIDGKWRPVCFMSRKLAKSQCNWTTREKETFAIVAALRKWAGVIGFQHVEVLSDHRSLEDWVTEKMDTPSGPRGRRARWHETLSQFDLHVKYVPGPQNVVPDALSRWAYPAASAREDVSFYGSAQAKKESREIEEAEKFEAEASARDLFEILHERPANMWVGVVTRSGKHAQPPLDDEEEDGGCPPLEPATPPALPSPLPLASQALPPPAEAHGGAPKQPDQPVGGEGRPGGPAPQHLRAAPALRPRGRAGAALQAADHGGAAPHDEQVCSPASHAPAGALASPLAQPPASPPCSKPRPPIPPIPPPRNSPADFSEKSTPFSTSVGDKASSAGEGVDRTPRVRFQLPPEMSRSPPAQLVDSQTQTSSPNAATTTPSKPQRRNRAQSILELDWAPDYASSARFQHVWHTIEHPKGGWPVGYKMLRGKLYYKERLCVPEAKVYQLCQEHHEHHGHLAAERLLPGLELRYEIAVGIDLLGMLGRVKRRCLVCQACQAPTWSAKQPIVMTPIPPRVMASVCLDIFSMPAVDWQGETFDCFLLCVDRHSGWTLARPARKAGLTGKKAAHLLLDGCWGEMGLPAIVTSDQGTQFTAQWWDTMRARLGIQAVYSQAHRPQANGRAEVAGKVLQELLRKMAQGSDFNWVEALPRALRIHHDTVDPVMGMSPYQAIFGRERALGGLPWQPDRDCFEAQVFFNRMQEIDTEIARKRNVANEKISAATNARRHRRPPYAIGDFVWVKRPKSVGGTKLQTWWRGPFKVTGRAGESSYMVEIPPAGQLDVHTDQLKPCIWESIAGEGVPLSPHIS